MLDFVGVLVLAAVLESLQVLVKLVGMVVCSLLLLLFPWVGCLGVVGFGLLQV